MVDLENISRRAFLKAFGMTVAGFTMVCVGTGHTSLIDADGCLSCGAILVRGHDHTEGEHAGIYCPNCGIEMDHQRFDLDGALQRFGAVESAMEKQVPAPQWDFSQVPFPNRSLVLRTNKPAVLLSDVRL